MSAVRIPEGVNVSFQGNWTLVFVGWGGRFFTEDPLIRFGRGGRVLVYNFFTKDPGEVCLSWVGLSPHKPFWASFLELSFISWCFVMEIRNINMPHKIIVIISMYIFCVPNWNTDSGVEVHFQSAGRPARSSRVGTPSILSHFCDQD